MKIIALNLDSSNMESIRYDREKRILFVEFKNGLIYKYFNIPVNIIYGFLESESKGKYFHANIRNDFKYEKVEEWMTM